MNTEIQTLIKMANQIADNIGPASDQERNATNAAEHISKFWAREMREKICDGQHEDLNPIAQMAVEKIRAAL